MQREVDVGETVVGHFGKRAYLRGVGHPGRVGERHTGDTEFQITLDETHHPRRLHIAFEGAAKAGADGAVDGDAASLQHSHHVPECLEGSVGALVHVGQVVRFRRRHEDVDFVRPARHGTFRAARIGNQCRIDHAGHALDARHDFGRVTHGGHRLGRDEGGHLDLGEACCREFVDQRDFHVGRDEHGFALQAVADADVLDVDALFHGYSRPLIVIPAPDSSTRGQE